jgi:phenylacetate-CoA ligase
MDLHAVATRNLIAPLWAWWEDSPYLAHHRQLERNQYDSPEIIQDRQFQALRSILPHAYETVPFYRERWQRIGLHPNRIHDFDSLQRVPILTKTDLRDHGRDLLSYSYSPSELIRKKTSGSTGVSLEVCVDEDSRQFKRACVLRSDHWSGWRLGEPVAKVWGNPEFRSRGWRGWLRNRLLEREYYLDTLRLDEAALAQFVRILRKKRPTLIFGHAHSVYLLAQYLQKRGREAGGWSEIDRNSSSPTTHHSPLTTHQYRPKGIITTAMVLHSWQRRTIEQVFDCPVTNRYGCEEVSMIACECERHHGLHINADSVYVEVLRTDETGALTRPARPGESGSVVVTDLTNRAMPIIRYQVGDMAVVSDQICPCGRGLPMLERIEGRDADYVVTPAGQLISGISLTENFALQVPGVVQFQIVQERLERFVFRLVRGPDFGPDSLKCLSQLANKTFGPEVEYRCEYLERIPSEPSGKYRFCISHVANPFTQTREVVAA